MDQPTASIASTRTQTNRTPATVSHFLEILPPEIRNEIYKYLMYNPLLADAKGSNKPTHGTPTAVWTNYDLSPALLQTCRQISEEASVILYEYNTFYFICNEPWITDPDPETGAPLLIALCPLTRRCQGSVNAGDMTLENVSAMSKVRRWRVFLNTWIPCGLPDLIALLPIEATRPATLVPFARAVSKHRLKSLELIITPMEDPDTIDGTTYLTPKQYLEGLRNIRSERINFIAGSLANTPRGFFILLWAEIASGYKDNLPDLKLQKEMRALVIGI